MNQRIRWLVVTKAEAENPKMHPSTIAIPFQGGAMPLFLILQIWDMDKWVDVPIDQSVELVPRDSVIEQNSPRKSESARCRPLREFIARTLGW